MKAYIQRPFFFKKRRKKSNEPSRKTSDWKRRWVVKCLLEPTGILPTDHDDDDIEHKDKCDLVLGLSACWELQVEGTKSKRIGRKT